MYRPEDWINPYSDTGFDEELNIYEAGADAMLTYIMKWLQLEGGNIREVRFDYCKDAMELLIEHPEMPRKEPGYMPGW